MPLSWTQRLSRLCKILGTNIVTDDEERQGQALDQYLGSRTKEGRQDVEALRFTDEDLSLIGRLAVGQFGTVDVVRCRLDSRVYVRKTIKKPTALRARGQCSPQLERDLLAKALKTNTLWAPHLLCAFQTETALKLVMQYADGGTLWDVIESSPEGKVSDSDLQWWAPQMVSAIEWCHSQNYVHRDIKPHNFVLTPTSHLLLVDFGSAAPLLPPSQSGIQLVPKENCLVPCGTCDYISPEILQFHEEALVALELEEEVSRIPNAATNEDEGGYGRETDWWSFGAMIYEMAFGVAPFFANDVGHTYIKIMEHRANLAFDTSTSLPDAGVSLLQGLLCDKERRLGRCSIAEIKDHDFFHQIHWTKLHQRKPPTRLHLPQFTYSASASDNLEACGVSVQEGGEREDAETDRLSQPFAFSALFQSSRSSPGISHLQRTPACNPLPSAIYHALAFVGFSWGPRLSAFNPPPSLESDTNTPILPALHRELVDLTPRPVLPLPITDPLPLPHVDSAVPDFHTPVRAGSLPLAHGHTISIPRTGTARRMQGRRPVSDREAMEQLVDCVGMSARKKVLESGKKPTYIRTTSALPGSKKEMKQFVTVLKPLAIDTRRRGDMSTTTSESESQPPSPTPRPGSALSRRSGRGGRSTPSLMAGRSTPTLTFTATGTASGPTLSFCATSNMGPATIPDCPTQLTPYDQKLRDAERKHSKLLAELTTLEKDISTIVLRLERT